MLKNLCQTLRQISIVAIVAALLNACGGEPSSPEEQIKAVIAAMEAAAEDRNRRGVSEHIADSFSSDHGGNKQAVDNVIRGYLLRNQSINIVTIIHSMQAISPQEYRVDLSALMAGKGVDLESESGRLKADKRRFQLTFVDESGEGEWVVRSASWK